MTTESGLFVRCGERELFVRGEAARAWFDRLRTVLDGTREVEEVEAGLGPGLTTAFPGVLKKLVEMDLVYDAAEDIDLPARVVDVYPNALHQLWDRCRRPNESFLRYREGTLVLSGSPAVASVVLRASAERGLGRVAILAGGETELGSLRSDVTELEAGPLDIEVSFVDRLDDVTGVAGVLHGSRAGYHGKPSRELSRYCQERRVPFLTAGRIGEMLYIGPLSNVPGASCMACAASYLDAAGNGTDPTSSRDQLYVTVMGGLMANWWFGYRTDMSPAIFGRDLVSVNCSSLATTSHVVSRRPDCPECGGRPTASALVGRHERDAAALATDAVFGWFASSSGDELSQVPLGQYEVVVNTRSEALGEDRPAVRVSAVSSDGLKDRASALGASLYLQSVDPVADPIIWKWLGDDREPHGPPDQPFEVTHVVADSAPCAAGMGLCSLALARELETGIDAADGVPLMTSVRSGEFGLTDELLELVKLCGIFAIGDVQVRKWRPSLPLPAWVVHARCDSSTATVVDIDLSRALSRCLSELLSSRVGSTPNSSRMPSELLASGLANDRFGLQAEWLEWLDHAEKQLRQAGFRVALGHGQPWGPLTWLGLASFHIGLCREATREVQR